MALDGAWARQRGASTGQLVLPPTPSAARNLECVTLPTFGLGSPGSRPVSRAGSRPSSRVGSRPQSKGSNVGIAPARRMVWSQDQFGPPDLDSFSRHDKGLSRNTHRENLSAEHAIAKIDESREANCIKLETGPVQTDPLSEPPAGMKDNVEMLAETFNMEVAAIECQLEDLGNSLAMSHLVNDGDRAEARAREEREAERRRHEAELRKARLKEKAARDPRRKIQLKLENKRRFEIDTLDGAGIPTTEVSVQGHRGGEKMRLVDVRALRSKCRGLSEGIHSVHQLVELQERKEKAYAALKTSSSMPTLGHEKNNPDDAILPSQVSWEDRYQRARHQKRCLTSESLVRKLEAMRTRPDRLPPACDAFAL